MATEQPAYTLIEQQRGFELRRYPPLLVAEVEVEGTFDAVGGRAFRLLADYIFGNNQGSRKIAMTAPVTQQPSGEARYRISFIMPAHFTRETLPRPNDGRVHIREIPARLVAAHRYSGGWGEGRYREHESQLLAAVQGAGLSPVGTPIYARYNSPFSLPFLRRNEVLVEVERVPTALGD
ncbi:heme-binding protein [Marichromatium gracile]|uniref:Heme-binding protein n=2 Tax=Marichromatium gracile TaxID=1048 RepID=A0ABR5VEU1_MARGR|nr:heme-binding protein [Marichromatium gracile]